MRNKILHISVLLLLVSITCLQWVKADQEQSRLEAMAEEYRKDLFQITELSENIGAVDAALIEEDKAIEVLQSQLPANPMIEPFIEELAELFHSAGIKIVRYLPDMLDHDLYQEIQIEITLDEHIDDAEVLMSIVEKSDRLAILKKIDKSDTPVLHLTIYSHSFKLVEPEIAECREPGPAAILYLPFILMVEQHQKDLHDLCIERQNSKDLLLKGELLQNKKMYKMGLKTIVEHLTRFS